MVTLQMRIDIRIGFLIQFATTWIWLVQLGLCAAQEASKAQPSRPSSGWSSAWQLGGRTQAATRLSGRGRFGVSQFGFHASLGYQEQPSHRIAFSLSYQQRAYEFQSLGRWMEAQPWDQVHFLSLSLPIRRQLTPDWSMMFIPTLRTMVEDLSDADQNMTGGGIAGFSYQISPRLRLGPGFGVLTQLEDDPSFFPVIVVDWDISDQWRLSTGRGAGASQGPGLTLSYDWSASWDFLLSGRYERFRFRTERQGATAHGVGEDQSGSIYLTAAYAMLPNAKLNLFTGGHFGGGLSVEDGSGRQISERNYDFAPLIGFNMSARF